METMRIFFSNLSNRGEAAESKGSTKAATSVNASIRGPSSVRTYGILRLREGTGSCAAQTRKASIFLSSSALPANDDVGTRRGVTLYSNPHLQILSSTSQHHTRPCYGILLARTLRWVRVANPQQFTYQQLLYSP